MKNTNSTPSNHVHTKLAAKGDKVKKKRKSSDLSVTGFVLMDNGECIPHKDLSPAVQQRLAHIWNVRAMQKIGYEPVYKPDKQNREGVAKE